MFAPPIAGILHPTPRKLEVQDLVILPNQQFLKMALCSSGWVLNIYSYYFIYSMIGRIVLKIVMITIYSIEMSPLILHWRSGQLKR